MSNCSPGLSYAASCPCICWHFKRALCLVMGYTPRVLRRLIRMVLPQATDIKSGSLCYTHLGWFDLYRKVTHSYMRLFQALLKRSSQDISSQLLLWKLLLSSGFHKFILLWVICLFKYHIPCIAVNKGANNYITMIPRREWFVKREKCLFCHSWITNIPINCFSEVV